MAAAAKIGERDRSLAYLNQVVNRYKSDGFRGWSHLDWNLNAPGGVFQEKWFPVNAIAASGLYRWMPGIQPTRSGVTIAPNIPAAMNGTNVAVKIRGTENLSVNYVNELSLVIDWSSSNLPVTVKWSGQAPGLTYTVVDNGVNYSAVADDFGTVRYA